MTCRRAACIDYFRKCSNNIKPLWETGLLSVFLKFSDSWPSLSWPTSTITAPPWWPRGAPTPLARAWPGRTPRLPRKNHFSETVEIFAKNAKQRVAYHTSSDIFTLCWVTLSTKLSIRLETYWTPATNHWFSFLSNTKCWWFSEKWSFLGKDNLTTCLLETWRDFSTKVVILFS